VTVAGVVKDARFRDIKQPLDPIMFVNSNNGHTHMIVRFNGDPRAARAGVERAWQTITTEVPFNADFSDDVMIELYEAEDARAKTFAAFAILAVSSPASAFTASPPSPPSGAPRRSAYARCWARAAGISCGCSPGSSPSP
jgi:hypothetical protein